jgi:predicted Zn-dependent peptidase
MDRVRALLLQEIRQREDQSGQKVMDVLRQRFFAGSPIGHDVLGTEETIGALQRSDLLEYWSDRYTANNMVVSIAGNFDWEQTMDQLARITASWPQGRGRMVMHEPEPRAGITVMKQDKTQEHLGFAFPAVAISDPHYYAGAVVAQALGGGSNSRLFREVREKRGLAYAAQARVDGLEKIGLYRIYVGTSAERAHESVEVVIDELRKLEQGGITEQELQLSKTRLKSQVIMRSESTSARMTSNLRSWWYEQKLRSLEEVEDEIDRVTLEEIDDLVKSLGITRNLAAAALGPRSEDELFGGILASP